MKSEEHLAILIGVFIISLTTMGCVEIIYGGNPVNKKSASYVAGYQAGHQVGHRLGMMYRLPVGIHINGEKDE